MNVRYIVELTSTEREALESLIAGGAERVRKVKRAQILLACDRGVRDCDIARTVNCGTATIYRTKSTFVEEGLERALNERSRPGALRKLTGREEAIPSTPPTQQRRDSNHQTSAAEH